MTPSKAIDHITGEQARVICAVALHMPVRNFTPVEMKTRARKHLRKMSPKVSPEEYISKLPKSKH